MFENLGKKLSSVFDKLKGRGVLTEDNINEALREVRIALLEADVALPVVKDFIEAVKVKALGQDVIRSISPGQMVVKIVHDHLIEVLGTANEDLNLTTEPPAVILMAGLQGSGKTTTTAKLARYLGEKRKKKILMASLDIYRPAAQKQLAVLGEQIGVDTLPIQEGQQPLDIAKRALTQGKLGGYDVVFLDTAGRLQVDDALMQELESVKAFARPIETLLIADSLTGQDAVHVAKTFQDRIGITGVILTRVDGDARGGAALSMRAVTGQPIKFIATGEKVDALEAFHPERIASRILDMGDVVSLVERAAESFEKEESEKLAKKLQKGIFDLDDMASQLRQINKMGGVGQMLSLMPGMGKIKERLADTPINDNIIGRQLAMLSSMTTEERRKPKLLDASRKRRIASGSGTSVQDLNLLLKQHLQMSKMMKKVKSKGLKGLIRGGLLPKF